MHVLKYAEDNSFFLSWVDDLSFLNYFKRSYFREGLRFGARTACNRTKPGEPLSLYLPDQQARCCIYINKDNLAGMVITDEEYPERMSFMIISKILKEFSEKHSKERISEISKDEELAFPQMAEYIKLYQNPQEVDKL